ncbi:MAG: amidohydrolase [Oscillospiraceae bacterium]|nr:amidohydrolase [Oscillospiraceae bacterium]MBP1574475.1 amidohydrolase [Oscillospiraceae bacterium]MBQ8595077.1 amidohydrolase [Oscillospiraceae bacterium]
MLFYNAGIFTACSDFIKNGYVLIKDGRIIDVGPMAFCPKDDEKYDLSGLTIYPGFIDAHCHLGMWEDGLSFEGDDGNEDTDPATPHLRALDAINPADYSFKEALEAGVTAVVTGPGSANPVAGQMVAIKTYGKRVDDMVIKAPMAMKFALGENPKNTYHSKDETPSTRMATAAIIREQLKKAQRYQRDILAAEEDEETDEPEIDVKSEALAEVVEGNIQSHFHAHRSDDIFTAIRLAKEFDLDLVLVHCTEGYLNAEKLAEEKARAIVGPLICTRTKPELSNERDENTAILKKAGVEVAICTDHPEVPIQYLPLSAGIAVRAGMDHDDAVRAITSVPAKILGLSDKIGSIAPGTDADIVVFKGDPLSVYETPLWVIAGGKIVKKP